MDSPLNRNPGSKIAVLEGDPTREGFFTMRLWVPDGYMIGPHWHPKVEHVTVISGAFEIGMGEAFDAASLRSLAAGSFGFMPKDDGWVAPADECLGTNIVRDEGGPLAPATRAALASNEPQSSLDAKSVGARC